MDVDGDNELARSLYRGILACARRLRQVTTAGEMSLAERAVLSRLERTGPTTAAQLARADHVSAQALGAVLASLERQGLIDRRGDPDDRRRVIVSVTATAAEALGGRHDARARRLADVLADGFSASELAVLGRAAPLLERLGEGL